MRVSCSGATRAVRNGVKKMRRLALSLCFLRISASRAATPRADMNDDLRRTDEHIGKLFIAPSRSRLRVLSGDARPLQMDACTAIVDRNLVDTMGRTSGARRLAPMPMSNPVSSTKRSRIGRIPTSYSFNAGLLAPAIRAYKLRAT